MIDRYTTPAMNAIWSRQAKYERWKDVEIAICEAHAEKNAIPAQALNDIKSKATSTSTAAMRSSARPAMT